MSNTLEETLATILRDLLESHGVDAYDEYWDSSLDEVAQLKSLILSEARRIGLEAIGEDSEHKHAIRVYDEGCQERDFVNKAKSVQRQRLLELTGGKE